MDHVTLPRLARAVLNVGFGVMAFGGGWLLSRKEWLLGTVMVVIAFLLIRLVDEIEQRERRVEAQSGPESGHGPLS